MKIRAKSSLIVLVSLIFLLTANPGVFAQAFDPAQILRHPQSYDGKRLTVSGRAQHVFAETTHQGKDYTTFDLCDDVCMKVLVWGHPRLSANQHQSVSGKFEIIKQVEGRTLENVLETQEGSIR